jgi:hypothetical protein
VWVVKSAWRLILADPRCSSSATHGCRRATQTSDSIVNGQVCPKIVSFGIEGCTWIGLARICLQSAAYSRSWKRWGALDGFGLHITQRHLPQGVLFSRCVRPVIHSVTGESFQQCVQLFLYPQPKNRSRGSPSLGILRRIRTHRRNWVDAKLSALLRPAGSPLSAEVVGS